MAKPAKRPQPDRNEAEEKIRRDEVMSRRFDRIFSPEIAALIETDAPEVVGGPGLPKRPLKPKRP